jgi:hypothetical protein
MTTDVVTTKPRVRNERRMSFDVRAAMRANERQREQRPAAACVAGER